jgi:exodeoxyribonuclease V alpha subunit
MERALRCGIRPPRVALLAPTGKASARLAEAIRRAKANLPVDGSVLALIPEEASTIHRCLGTFRGSATAFRHGLDNPLVADVVLVDEASMVDLALLRRLLDAVAPHARVILLGDKDQLASVEAGAVLGDICNSGRQIVYSRPWTERLRELTGEALPGAAKAPPSTGIWDCIVQLRHSYRSAEAPLIGALAAAINEGDADEVVRMLDSPDCAYVVRHEPGERGALSTALRGQIVDGFGVYLRLAEPAEQLLRLDRFRILCAHRRGLWGVTAINPLVESALAEARLIDTESTAYVGRPVLISENDYQLNLFNGDVGVIGADPAASDKRLVFFDAGEGRLRTLSPSRLPPHETAYATSVHKSQGSEFDRVAIVLPDKPSPVLSRELLYTAVTRARTAVAVHATGAIIRATISRRVERASGLREALWGSGG